VKAVTRSYQPIAECQYCGGPMPASATTGRRRVYCSAACRKAAYEMRRARKPDATRVKLVDRGITETRETVKGRRRGPRDRDLLVNVAQSPRACANVVGHLAGMARNKELLDEFESTWQVTDDGFRLTTVIPMGGP
jgi:hypothetical protein